MISKIAKYCILVLVICVLSCTDDKKNTLRFRLLDQDESGISFSNELNVDGEFNIYTYRNFYNGGGVGLGDFDNDGLTDIYFTSNMRENHLYRNTGDLKFKNITKQAGVSGSKAWSTGVSIVDINADGYLDIYVCNSGDVDGDDKQNELFINNGDLTFSERAKEYGIDDIGYSTHAAFLDYDGDGDLDMYLLNNSYQAIGSFNLKKNVRDVRDVEGGDKLYRNEGNSFIDVSEEAGIYGSIIGFGLGVTVGDVDRDGWPDIYVSNDFFERDYLYINNQDGTFREDLTKRIRSISGASMGADMADINNDGYQDIFVTEMLPKEDARLKTKTTFENWDKYQYNLDNEYYHQFTRNMLHQNLNGDNFQEIGRLKDVHATDWSWGALIEDFDNDGYRDIFVANGIYQDLTDQDFLNYIGTDSTISKIISKDGVDYDALIDAIPSNPIPNYMFKNKGRNSNFDYEEVGTQWGLDAKTFSNGAAYGDLDNDGDLELVINNVNMPAYIYENNSSELDTHAYINVRLRQSNSNPFAYGASMEVYAQGKYLYQENLPTRGFQSSVDYKMTIGLGDSNHIDSIVVQWSPSQRNVYRDIEVNQTLLLTQDEDRFVDKNQSEQGKKIFELLEEEIIDFEHQENDFVDFDRNKLLYHMRSAKGPCMCTGDVNNDGLEDIFFGGAKDQSSQLFVQMKNGKFKSRFIFEDDKISEDTDCIIFDADNDGDLDIYVTSGGFEFPETSSALLDRLYVNEDNHKFIRSSQILPAGRYESTVSVDAADFDLDGDMDLLVGVGFKPFAYGIPVSVYVLENDGFGVFSDVTINKAPELKNIGLITDVILEDIDNDGYPDIVVVGEWLAPQILIYNKTTQTFKNITADIGVSSYKGWWKTAALADVNNDGLKDLIAGNIGLNTSFKADKVNSLRMYVNDFDQNGSIDHIYAKWNRDGYYPMALKHDLIAQLPSLKKQFVQYKDYPEQKINDLFTKELLDNSILLEVNYMDHMVFLNSGRNDPWQPLPLNYATQFSSINDIYINHNNEHSMSMIVGGNNSYVKPEIGKYDASYGHYLVSNDSTNNMDIQEHSGLLLEGDISKLVIIKRAQDKLLIAASNNSKPQIFKYDDP